MPEIRLVEKDEVFFLIKKLFYQVAINCIQIGTRAGNHFSEFLELIGVLEHVDYVADTISEHKILKIVLVFLSSACCIPVVGFLFFAFITFCFFVVAYPLVLAGAALFAIPIFLFLFVCLSLTGTVASVVYFISVGLFNLFDICIGRKSIIEERPHENHRDHRE